MSNDRYASGSSVSAGNPGVSLAGTTLCKKVSIIILNLNSYEMTSACLLSLAKINYDMFDVLVVDNGSTDQSADRLQQSFPELHIIRNRSNLGFTGGNNVGLRDALGRNPDYLLLLNNDTIVAPDFLTEMIRVAESDPSIGILNPKIYYFEPQDRIWYAGSHDKFWPVFPKIDGRKLRDDGRYDQVREVSFITGCAFLIKAEVVRRIGLLDDIYFLSFEDRDWSVRALRAGFKAVYVPSSIVWHKEAHDTKRQFGVSGREYYVMRNTVFFARKHLAKTQWPLYVASLGKYLLIRTCLYMLTADIRRIGALYRGVWCGFSTEIPTHPQELSFEEA